MTRPVPQPGIAARYTSDCPRCHGEIRPGDRVYYQRGEACHVRCAPGGDE